MSRSPIDGKYIKSEAKAGVGSRLMAIVAEEIMVEHLSPTPSHEVFR